jgi:hypothetical protein
LPPAPWILSAACTAGLFPEELLTATDEVLGTVEGELLGLGEANDELPSWNASSWPLNAVDEAHDGVA